MKKKKLKLLMIIFWMVVLGLILTQNSYANTDLKNTTKAYFCSEITKNYGNGDCILLENYDSNGNKIYGLIDCGRKIATKNQNGESSTVVNEFLKEHGVQELEFLIITHSHGDHNGDVITVLNNFNVKTIYMKEFDNIWSKSDGTQITYENIIKTAIEKETKIVGVNYNSTISSEISPSASASFMKYMNENSEKQKLFSSFNETNISFQFGSSNIKLFNWEIFDENGNLWISGESTTNREKTKENNNSLCILLTQGNKKAVFSGDMNNLDADDTKGRIGDEDRVKDEIGEVDFLKLGHHGYEYSNTERYLETLNPQYAVITNDIGYTFWETIDWLEQHNVDYLYTTNDESAIIVTLTENNVYMNFEKTNGFKRVDKKLYYFSSEKNDELKNWKDNVCQKIEYEEIKKNANSWGELKKLIEDNKFDYSYNSDTDTMKIPKLEIRLTADNFKADSTIQIELWQNIELTTDKNVMIERANDLKNGCLISNSGNLSIGEEKMLGNITLDGKNIESTSCLLENYGILNIYEGIIIQNNYKKINSLVKATTTISYSAYGSGIYCSSGIINMYGGKISNNKNSVDYELVLDNKVITNNYDLSCYGTGVYLNDNSELNMYSGEISNNYAENNSIVNIKNNTTNKNSREISQKICGVGIYANNSIVNVNSATMENNTAKNNSKFYLTGNSEIYSYRNKNYGVAIYNQNSKVLLENMSILNNNSILNNIATIDEGGKIEEFFYAGTNGVSIYLVSSNTTIRNSTIKKSIIDNTNYYFKNNGTIKNYVEINQGGGIDSYQGSFKMFDTTIEENSADQGGGIYVYNANVELDNVTLTNNTAKYGGGLYVSNSNSDTIINNSTIQNNTTNEGSGAGIYAYGKLTINGASTKITDNTAKTFGGGIMVKNFGVVNAGEISNNQTQQYAGGGIRVDGKLIMNGGTVTNNYATTNGGGIDYTPGKFYYTKGTIENNTAKKSGNDLYPTDQILQDTIEPNLTISTIPSSWTKENIPVTITAADDETSIKSVTVNEKNILSKDGIVVYTAKENGTYIVRATDNVGNFILKQFTITTIDKEPPVITGISENGVYYDPVTINAKDALSGIKSVILKKDGNQIEFNLGQTISEIGNYEITIQDNVSNTVTKNFVIDTRFSADDHITISGINTQWSNKDQNIDISISKPITSMEINNKQVSLVNNVYTLVVTENGVYDLRIVDLEKNEILKRIEITNIDKTTPQIYGAVDTKKYDGAITLTIRDEESEIDSIKMEKDGQAISSNFENQKITVSDIGTYYISATNNAGGTSELSFEIIEKELNSEDNSDKTETENNSKTGKAEIIRVAEEIEKDEEQEENIDKSEEMEFIKGIPANDGEEELSNNNSKNKDTSSANEQEVDNTTISTILPNTGFTRFLIITVIILAILGITHGKKYISYLKDTHKQL